MNFIDLVILIIFSVLIYRGYSKGVISSLIKLAGLIVSLICAKLYHPFVKTTIVEMTKIDESIKESIAKRLIGLGAQNAESMVSGSDLNAFSKMPFPNQLKSKAVDYLTEKATEQVMNVSSMVTDLVMSFIAMIVLFILIWLFFTLVSSAFNWTAKLPGIKSFNKLGGAIIGGFIAYFVNSLVFLVFMTISALKVVASLETQIQTSFLAKYFFEYNIFVVIGRFFN